MQNTINAKAFTFPERDSLSNDSIIKLLKDNRVITIRNRQSHKIGLIMKQKENVFGFRFKCNDKDMKADVANDPAVFIIDSLRHLQGCYYTCDTLGKQNDI